MFNIFSTKNVKNKGGTVTKKLNLKRRNDKGKLEIVAEISPEASRIAMIQMLIPLGMQAVTETLLEEVNNLVGNHYERNDVPLKRWGSNPGSVFLGDQKVKIRVPRIRNQELGKEVQLETYEALQSSSMIDDKILASVLGGISARKFESTAVKVPETFGIKKSAVSKRFIKATAKKLKEFSNRNLSQDDIVAIFIDGKIFAKMNMLVALGVDLAGKKKFLGIIETASENHQVVRDFILNLETRGLDISKKILFIIDGAKGLSKGIKSVFGKQAIIQRCQWHKRENIVSYLPREKQKEYRRKLQKAYEMVDYDTAKNALLLIEEELKSINMSAVGSLNEGIEETLTLQQLGVFDKLGTSFKTTNCIESANRQLSIYTGRVSRWKTSNQRQRWVAASLLELEPRMKRVKGYKQLSLLREKMEETVLIQQKKAA